MEREQEAFHFISGRLNSPIATKKRKRDLVSGACCTYVVAPQSIATITYKIKSPSFFPSSVELLS